MKEYRFKNERELEADFGKDWRKKFAKNLPFIENNLGKLVAPINNGQIAHQGFDNFYGKELIKEIPQVACDVKSVYFNEDKRSVTVVLRNGNQAKSTCNPSDEYDPYIGFAVAYARAILGSSTQLRKYVDTKLDRLHKKGKKASK